MLQGKHEKSALKYSSTVNIPISCFVAFLGGLSCCFPSGMSSFGLLLNFLAVQDSSIGDIVSQSVIKSVRLLISASPEHYRAVVDF